MIPAPERPRVRPTAVPVIAGGSAEADASLASRLGPTIEAEVVAVIAAAAVIGFGIIPSPLLHLAANAARAIF
jgi:hypothetical protein